MSVELQILQEKLNEALQRIACLEQRVNDLAQQPPRWPHLVARPTNWRSQLWLRDRNMTVGQLVSAMIPNRLTPEAASVDLGLPLEAIYEALAYYEENKELIQQEATQERQYLAERGYSLEPQLLPR